MLSDAWGKTCRNLRVGQVSLSGRSDWKMRGKDKRFQLKNISWWVKPYMKYVHKVTLDLPSDNKTRDT